MVSTRQQLKKIRSERNNPVKALPNDVMQKVWKQLGMGRYRYVAGVDRSFRTSYTEFCESEKKREKEKIRLYLIDDLKWASRNYSVETHKRTHSCVACESLPCLQIFENEGLDREIDDMCGSFAISAASMGNLDVLKYLKAKQYSIVSETYLAATKKQHLHVLKWLHAVGVPWHILGVRTCEVAAEFGHLDILQWLVANGFPWDKSVCFEASTNGHLNVLKWAVANGCPLDANVSLNAARCGHLNVLKWAVANGCPWDAGVCSHAAWRGNLDMLQWAVANGCPCDEFVTFNALTHGHLNVLKWAVANGCPCDTDACSSVAADGNLELLQWAVANGCPWDANVSLNAARSGHLNVLKWAVANGCPWNIEECLDEARRYGNGEVELYLKKQAMQL